MLLSLDIQGFKSFPELTQIEFHKGITAIVGPNGAGKSNLTDAIRWVLGEQSARTLRGRRMEDVIFSGTAQRRPVSFADVTLTLDNSEGILDIDYEKVAITRRYYRSGDSEYLINKTPCRLRDIHSLLMDTGIGLDGYSIIGQGRIDEILSSKSEDRRAIFEEASGIVQFRTRKEEALRKLDKSQQNLVRVDDLLAELESQETALKKQADDARSHIDLARRYRELDIALTLRQIENLEEQKAKGEEDARLLASDLEEARKLRESAKAAQESSGDRLAGIDRAIDSEQAQFNAHSVREMECRGLEALYKEKYSGSKLGAESLLEEKNRLLMQVMAAAETIKGQESKRSEIAGRKARLEAEHQEKEKELQEREAELSGKTRSIQAAIQKRDRLAEELSSIRAQLREEAGERQALEARLARLSDEDEKRLLETRSAKEGLDEIQSHLASLKEAISQGEEEAKKARQETENGHRQADRIEQQIDELEQRSGRLAYEAETLERLESDFEGYARPVQLLMQEVRRKKDNTVMGPLGSLLTVPKKLQTAIETSLGGMAHQIVCQDADTAKIWIDWLSRTKSGRATFLPLTELSVRTVEEKTLAVARGWSGWVGLASDLVGYDPAIEDAVRYALGRILVVETLDQAVALSRKTDRSQSVVTLAGDVVHRGGSMTGGYRAVRGTGVIGRPGRIRELKEEISSIRIKAGALETELEEAKEKLRLLAGREEAILQTLADNKKKEVRAEADESSRLSLHDRLTRDLEEQRRESSQIEDRLKALLTREKAQEEEIGKLELRRQESLDQIQSLEEESRTGQEAYRASRDQVTRLSVSISSLEESLADFDALAAHARGEIERAEVRLSSVEREWADQTARMEEARLKLVENEADLALAVREREESQARLTALMESREEESSGQRALVDEMDRAHEQLAALQSVYERQDAEIRRTAQQIADQMNRLWESHGITRSEAEAEAGDIGPLSRAQSERTALRRRIEDLGPINHNAIRDHEALTARIEYTASQREDIERARTELSEVIGQLDQSMREQFNRTLHDINQNFNQVFTELFSGGKAEITLEGEDDVLQADIGIRAQPPGKKLQNLTLLSGGERSLTAIALLFAILKLKPAPFCVFDEVESALDDANVKRFTDYVRRYAWSMQFILVTHRKGTMEAADRLYGVTMQERGISRVLSMVLSSALPYGE